MSQFSTAEDKGQYCQFVLNEEGKYELKPVKVPAHVKAERAARIRKREQQIAVERNRARAAAMDARYVFFMAVILSLLIVVCCIFLTYQNKVNTRLNSISSLQSQIETLVEDNDVLQKRLDTAMSIADVSEKAKDDLGMTQADPDQVYYYSASGQDFMVQYSDVN